MKNSFCTICSKMRLMSWNQMKSQNFLIRFVQILMKIPQIWSKYPYFLVILAENWVAPISKLQKSIWLLYWRFLFSKKLVIQELAPTCGLAPILTVLISGFNCNKYLFFSFLGKWKWSQLIVRFEGFQQKSHVNDET